MKVLVLSPPGLRTIEILAEGVHLQNPNVQFTVLDSLDTKRNVSDPGVAIEMIETPYFKLSNVSRAKKITKLFAVLFKTGFNFRKAKELAVYECIEILRKQYYSTLFKKFDVINVQYLHASTIDILNFIPKTNKVLLSFWGSDLFRVLEEDKVLKQQKVVEMAKVITLHSIEMQDFLEKKYSNIDLSKLRQVLFGMSYKIIDNISSMKKESPLLFLEKYNIPSEKMIIKVGYNAEEGQQHIEILMELAKLTTEQKENIHLLVPFTYGGSKDYIMKVRHIMSKIGITHTIFSKFLNDVEVLQLSQVSDVMLNLRTTDALNNSMMESLLFENVVVNGSWLPYSLLETSSISIVSIDSMYDIVEQVGKLLFNFENYRLSMVGNFSKVEKLISNKHQGKVWLGCYNDIADG